MGKGNIRSKSKAITPEQRKNRLDNKFIDDPDEQTIDFCWKCFIVDRRARQNTEASLDAYRRFYKKLSTMIPLNEEGEGVPNWPIGMLDDAATISIFIASLKDKNYILE